MQNKQEVVVTGIGLVTPLGYECRDVWDRLIAGENGIKSLDKKYEDLMRYNIHVAGICPDITFEEFRNLDNRKKARMRNANKAIKMAVYSGLKALEDAEIDLNTDCDRYNIGSIIGTGTALGERYEKISLDERNPKWFLETYPNAINAFLSIIASIKGYGSTIVNACVGGTQAIGEAYKKIQYGEEQVLIAGGVDDKLSRIYASGFSRLGMSSDSKDPENASRPFDKDRNGLVIGQGACCLVLESLEHAMRRGVKIKGQIVGYGSSMDAESITDTSGMGKAKAMQRALEDANLEARKIGYINAHGTSTIVNDREESVAIEEVFGKYGGGIPISSTKSIIGHTFAACGAIQSFVCLKSLEHQRVHGNRNFRSGDTYCNLNYIESTYCDINMSYCMSNTSGIGGCNSTLIFKSV